MPNKQIYWEIQIASLCICLYTECIHLSGNKDCVFKISVEPGKEDKQIIHFFPQIMCVSRCEKKVNICFYLYMEIVVKKSLHIFCECYCDFRASLVAQLVNNPPAKQESLVRFLGWEDPLEKG